jgi:hypothetical protein
VSNFGKALFILFVCNFSALGITPQTDTFDGNSLNPSYWIEAFADKNNKGSSSFGVANGRLNFYVSSQSTETNTENSRIIENKMNLPSNENWVLRIGVHNSAPYSLIYGSSQLQLLVTDVNYDFNYGVTLAQRREFPQLPIFGLIGKDISGWNALGGIIQPSKTSSSVKYSFNKNSKELAVYISQNGSDPISNNNYKYYLMGSTNLTTNSIAAFKFLILQNIWNVQVGESQMWVDNFQITNGAQTETQESSDLINWETSETKINPITSPRRFYRLKIQE